MHLGSPVVSDTVTQPQVDTIPDVQEVLVTSRYGVATTGLPYQNTSSPSTAFLTPWHVRRNFSTCSGSSFWHRGSGS